MLETTTDVALVPVEKKIEQELSKANVTDKLIATLKEKYMPLKIVDKETAKEVIEARKDCKNWRVLARKICEAGREDAVKVQKAWVAKQAEVTDKISEVEDYLEAQEKEWKAAEEKAKMEKKREMDERVAMRQQELMHMGVNLSGGAFYFKDIVFSFDMVRDTDEDVYRETIFPAFKAAYDKDEEERIAQEKERQEAAEKQRQEAEQLRQEQEAFKKEQDEMKQQRYDVRLDRLKALGFEGQPTVNLMEISNSEYQAFYESVAEDNRRKQKEDEERKEQERIAEERERLLSARTSRLEGINVVNGIIYSIAGEVVMNNAELIEMQPEEFEEYAKAFNILTDNFKSEQERKRQEEEEQKAERKRVNELDTVRRAMLATIGDKGDDINYGEIDHDAWGKLYNEKKQAYDQKKHEEWLEQERNRKEQENAAKQLALEAAKDKEKWQEVLAYLDKTPILDMRSNQYRTKMKIVRDFLTDIKSK